MNQLAAIASAVVCLLAAAQAPQAARQPAAGLESKLSLGAPVQIGTLAVVPIESTLPLAPDKYLTLAEATKLGVVEIIETPGQEQVNSLEVRNKSDLPILLFAGELLLGGKQDRIVAKDSIVPSHERRDVPVFCVEHGRWNGSPQFAPANTLVNNAVRTTAVFAKSQQMVWDSVAGVNQQTRATPATGTIRGTLDDPKVRDASERLFTRLDSRFLPGPKTVGVICWMNGKIQSADVYANAALFKASKAKLFRSYCIDVQLLSDPVVVPVDLKACRAFLDEIVTARRENSGSDAYGRNYLISNGRIIGAESGTNGFNGSIGGGAGGAGFGHGTYQPGGGH